MMVSSNVVIYTKVQIEGPDIYPTKAMRLRRGSATSAISLKSLVSELCLRYILLVVALNPNDVDIVLHHQTSGRNLNARSILTPHEKRYTYTCLEKFPVYCICANIASIYTRPIGR